MASNELVIRALTYVAAALVFYLGYQFRSFVAWAEDRQRIKHNFLKSMDDKQYRKYQEFYEELRNN